MMFICTVVSASAVPALKEIRSATRKALPSPLYNGENGKKKVDKTGKMSSSIFVAAMKFGSPGMSNSALMATLLKILFGLPIVKVTANRYASVLKKGKGS